MGFSEDESAVAALILLVFIGIAVLAMSAASWQWWGALAAIPALLIGLRIFRGSRK